MVKLWYALWAWIYSRLANHHIAKAFTYHSKSIATRLYAQLPLKSFHDISDDTVIVAVCQLKEEPFTITLSYTIKNKQYSQSLEVIEKQYGPVLMTISLTEMREQIVAALLEN